MSYWDCDAATGQLALDALRDRFLERLAPRADFGSRLLRLGLTGDHAGVWRHVAAEGVAALRVVKGDRAG